MLPTSSTLQTCTIDAKSLNPQVAPQRHWRRRRERCHSWTCCRGSTRHPDSFGFGDLGFRVWVSGVSGPAGFGVGLGVSNERNIREVVVFGWVETGVFCLLNRTEPTKEEREQAAGGSRRACSILHASMCRATV